MVHDMKKSIFTLVWLLSATCAVQAQEHPDSTESPHPWRAVGEVALANGMIHLTGRYLMNEPYAKTALHSIRRNLNSGFVWDDDNFLLNHVGHPTEGTLYYNAARSSGMNFWQSLPFVFAGSLMWEMAGEREKPSINDMITTTVVGAGLGEVTHRLAGRIIREQEHGPRRFFREVSAALINPAQGFNRLVTGRAWKIRHDDRAALEEHDGHPADEKADDDSDAPRLMLGGSYLAASDDFQNGRVLPFFAFSIDYGQAADGEQHHIPYDFFTGEAALNFGKGQPFASHLQVTGRLCSMPIADNRQMVGELGLYQFFDYENYELKDSTHTAPFPYGEMASVGPGITLVMPQLTPVLSAEQRFYVKGIVLGASKTDYYHVDKRSYNYGSGYGSAMMSRLKWQKVGMVQLDADYLHLYTISDKWGDRGDTRILSLGLKVRASLSQSLSLMIGATRVSRHSHYRTHPSHSVSCYQLETALQLEL